MPLLSSSMALSSPEGSEKNTAGHDPGTGRDHCLDQHPSDCQDLQAHTVTQSLEAVNLCPQLIARVLELWRAAPAGGHQLVRRQTRRRVLQGPVTRDWKGGGGGASTGPV